MPGPASPADPDVPGLGPWRQPRPPAGFVPFPAPEAVGSVAARFLAVAADRPDHVALRSPAGAWTYAELAAEVRRRAAALADLVDPAKPTPVALLLPHDGPLVAMILSVIAAGHAVVVLDPVAPAAQGRHVLAESGAPIVVHDAATEPLLAELLGDGVDAVPVPIGDLDPDPTAAPPAADPAGTARGLADPLMLAFTSGTSGSPKAATITHGVLLNLIRGATGALGIGPDDRMPMLFPTSMAVAAYPMFLPLLNGGTLATLDVRSVGLAPVADFLADERITLAYMAPTVVRFLVDALAGRTFPDLRLIALGGELVDAEAVRITADAFGPRHLANGFGTTETGVITLYVFEPGDPFEGAVPAGYPVPDVEVLVLDDHGVPLPVGEAGEVAITSPHVFTGYWGHHDLDDQVLAPDPQGRAGWRLYRTGDLGRLDQQGALTVLGRLDAKVKVRGRFVVLGDVEAALHDLDEVGDAGVVAIERSGVTELVGLVVPAAGATVDPVALRARLLQDRDAYAVPSRWEVIDELPRLPNGKVDRQALATAAEQGSPAELLERSFARSAEREAEPLARTVRDIWELLLPVGLVGLDEDFFHAGGDSLLAAQMLVLVEERTGTTVPMGELVHARTVRQLVEVIARIRRDGELEPSTASCVQAGSPDRPRLWFVHDLQGSAYRVRHLAEHLGADQPVWSFESPLLRGIANPFPSLEAFAARYVRDLRASQPEGPYWLGGYSFGGITAYEMARQLRRLGEEVAFCAVVDVGPGYRGTGWGDRRSPFRPWFGVAKPPPEGASAREAFDHYVAMARTSPKGAARHLMVRSGVARVVDPLRFRADLRRTGRIRPEWRLWYAWEEHWRLAARAWDRANTYDGIVDLFWADDTPSADATLGWGPQVGELRIHRFAGDHLGILEPRGAPALAKALRAALDERIGGGAASTGPADPDRMG
jgi:amino acid adenylation domain-containing protein